MRLDLGLEIVVNGSVVVELADEAEESGELITLIDRVVELPEAVDDLEQDTHEVREDGDTEQENDSAYGPLLI